MSDVTPRLGLPLLAAAQAQKHVTHNEALTALDALTQIAVTRRCAAAPADAVESERFLVTAPASGVFLDKEGAIAARLDGGWRFHAPHAGWLAWIEQERRLVLFDGADWVDPPARAASVLGVNATADATNRLAVRSPAVLFSHENGDLRVTMNKASAAATASLALQSNWSGRAEIGLAGSDDLRVKVSADGALWKDALTIDRASGVVTFAQGAIGAGAPRAGRNRLRNPSFRVNQRGVSGAVTLAAGAYGHDGVKAGAGGATYAFAAAGLDVALTISAGTLILPVEAAMMEGGDHTLSHEGTAPARIWQGTGVAGSGAYQPASAPAGLVAAGLAAGVQTQVEFGPGAVLRPQLEPGTTPTVYERRSFDDEYRLCERYVLTSYNRGVTPGTPTQSGAVARQVDAATNYGALQTPFRTRMRATPSVTVFSPSTGAAGKIYNQYLGRDSAGVAGNVGETGCMIYIWQESDYPGYLISAHYLATADL